MAEKDYGKFKVKIVPLEDYRKERFAKTSALGKNVPQDKKIAHSSQIKAGCIGFVIDCFSPQA